MDSAERVRRHRQMNRIEQLADELLQALREAPDPLPRLPVIEPELVHRLSVFTITQDEVKEEGSPMRFLELGNGHQHANRKKAIYAAERLLDGAAILDERTLATEEFGKCHFAAFTHPKGAMISSPNKDDNNFGDSDWHSCDNVVMFRDAGDGRCIIYVSPIQPLFGLRTIGKHGVTWEDVRKTAKVTKVFPTSAVVAAANRL